MKETKKKKPAEPVVIGCEAKHVITGEMGILVGKSESLNGMVQFALKRQDRDKEGKAFDEKWLDREYLDRIGDGCIDRVVESVKTDIELGMTVKHFSGFTGVATDKVWYMNGCLHIGVVSKAKDPDKMPETQYIASQYLTPDIKKKSIVAKKDETGGPSLNIPSRT